MNEDMGDAVTRFLVERTRVRAEHVKLIDAWREVLARHPYPPIVAKALGELMAGVALLSATLKFDGSLLVQMTGPGPVRMLLAQADRTGGLRALARPAVEATADDAQSNPSERGGWRSTEDWVAVADLQAAFERALAHSTATVPTSDVPGAFTTTAPGQIPGLSDLLGSPARLIITLEPPRGLEGGERYQGVVAIDGMTCVAEALDHYFTASEQLPTRLWLAASHDARQAVAAGLLIQGLPDSTGAPMARTTEDWKRMTILADTVRDDELCGLPFESLVGRLFAEEDLRRFASTPLRFACSCSRARVEAMLRALGDEEVEDLLDDGRVSVTCEFCNTCYEFDAVDLEALRHAPETVQADHRLAESGTTDTGRQH
ncbi:MAG: Hsp33 family molecular chaperone HslO [Thioalkalivibrionaceae bacterium]